MNHESLSPEQTVAELSVAERNLRELRVSAEGWHQRFDQLQASDDPKLGDIVDHAADGLNAAWELHEQLISLMASGKQLEASGEGMTLGEEDIALEGLFISHGVTAASLPQGNRLGLALQSTDNPALWYFAPVDDILFARISKPRTRPAICFSKKRLRSILMTISLMKIVVTLTDKYGTGNFG